MTKKILILALGLSLSACGTHKTVYKTVQGEPVSTPTPIHNELQDIVDAENSYRNGQGLSPLTTGLKCTLYTFTAGDRIQSSIAGHDTLSGLVNRGNFLMEKEFNQPNTGINEGLNILPDALRVMYKNMYKVSCSGVIVAQTDGYYNFQLTSDDASVLYIGGSKLIDHDNNHGCNVAQGQKYLRKGVHAFRLDYAQTGGSQCLLLSSNEEILDSKLFYK